MGDHDSYSDRVQNDLEVGSNSSRRPGLAAVQKFNVQEFKVNFHVAALKPTLSRKRKTHLLFLISSLSARTMDRS